MKKYLAPLLLLLLATSSTSHAQVKAPLVKMETSFGEILIELFPNKAPQTVANFLRYVNEGFYNGTIFHRVIDNFMIQGGGFAPDFQQKPTHEPIVSEANNRLKNQRGTVAMARTDNPHSATAQFFINVRDNNFLDYAENATEIKWGYTVFGKVIKGMEVADKIQKLKTGSRGPLRTDVPLTTVTIEKMFVVRAKD